MNTKTLAGGVLLLISVGLLGPRIIRFEAVDSCLDLGGSFDYEKGVCDYNQSHPYQPSKPMNPLALSASIVSGIVGFALIVAKRRKQSDTL
jgi:hypothetical protein